MSARRGVSHARYVLINRLATPVGALLILMMMGRQSDRLLGEYALVMTFYFVMQMLPLLGLTPYVMRETARRPERAGTYFMSIGLLSLAGCVVVDIGCFGLLRVLRYESPLPESIAIVGLLIFPGILLFVAELIFMSLDRAKPVAMVAIVENIVRLVVTGAALWLDGGLIAVVWVFFATRSTALVAYVVIMRRTGILRPTDRPSAAILRETIRVLPAFVTGAVLFVLANRLDFFVLSLYQAVDVIGNYAIAYRVFDISINVLTALIMALFPWTARKFVGARSHFRAAVRSILLAFIAGLGFACFAGVLLAQYYVLALFPNQYPQPVLLTQLFVAALFVAGMDFVASGLLYASDRQAADTGAMALGGVATTGLLFALVPRWGAFGAFLAKLSASLLQAIVKFVAIDRLIGPLWRRGEVARVAVVVAVLSLLALALVNAGVIVKLLAIVATGLVVLPALMIALKLFQPLRLLRYYWHPRNAHDVAGIANLVDVVVRDLRRHDRQARTRALAQPPSSAALYALVMARVARHLSLAERARLAAAFAWIGERLLPSPRIDELCPLQHGLLADARARIASGVFTADARAASDDAALAQPRNGRESR